MMGLELYQQETAKIAQRQLKILNEVAELMDQGKLLTPLEQNGVLHALQVLMENAIGKAKHLIKSAGGVVLLSAYDRFSLLSERGEIDQVDVEKWNSAIGLRNKILHDDINLRMDIVLNLVKNKEYEFIGAFLLKPILKD